MIPSGKARLAGVVGWPVEHSLSPRLHGYWLDHYRIDAAYDVHTEPHEHQRFFRAHTRNSRWSPAAGPRPEGLVVAASSSGPRFDAGGLDGDNLQGMVFRYRRVKRPTD